jgi:hypothetical protein
MGDFHGWGVWGGRDYWPQESAVMAEMADVFDALFTED